MTEQSYRLFIGGEWVEPSAGRYSIVNPATEQGVAEAPEAGVDQVADAVAAARAAFPAWARRPAAERADRGDKSAEAGGGDDDADRAGGAVQKTRHDEFLRLGFRGGTSHIGPSGGVLTSPMG